MLQSCSVPYGNMVGCNLALGFNSLLLYLLLVGCFGISMPLVPSGQKARFIFTSMAPWYTESLVVSTISVD